MDIQPPRIPEVNRTSPPPGQNPPAVVVPQSTRRIPHELAEMHRSMKRWAWILALGSIALSLLMLTEDLFAWYSPSATRPSSGMLAVSMMMELLGGMFIVPGLLFFYGTKCANFADDRNSASLMSTLVALRAMWCIAGLVGLGFCLLVASVASTAGR